MYILPEHFFAQYLRIVYKLQNGLFPFQPDVIYLVKALDERQKSFYSVYILYCYIKSFRREVFFVCKFCIFSSGVWFGVSINNLKLPQK